MPRTARCGVHPVYVASKSLLRQAKLGLCGSQLPAAWNGAKGDRKHIIHNLYPSRKGAGQTPKAYEIPTQGLSIAPLYTAGKVALNQANKQKPTEKSGQTPKTPKLQPHISSLNFSQRSSWCQDLRKSTPLRSRPDRAPGARAEPALTCCSALSVPFPSLKLPRS